MDFTRTGIILNTQNYIECVHFYGIVLGLPISHRIGQEKMKSLYFTWAIHI